MGHGTGSFDAGERAAQRLEQAELVEPGEAAGRKPPQLAENPFLGGRRDQLGVAADERLGLGDEPKAERQLVLEPRPAQEPQRIVPENGLLDGAQTPRFEVRIAAERVDLLVTARPLGDRVDGEVPSRQIVLDRPAQRREIDRPAVRERNPPGAVALGERERRASGLTGVAPRRALRLGKRDVHVDDGPVEHPVADGAADDPGVFVGEKFFDELTNRRPPAWCGRDRR